MPTDRDASPALSWVCDLLWPEGSAVHPRLGSAPGPGERSWWVLPSVAEPTLLVPDSGAGAAAALRQFNDSMSQGARVAKAAVGALARYGAVGIMRRDRLWLHPTGSAGEDFIGILPEVFGVARLDVAVSIGRQLRPNLKPVLQAIAPDGRVIGYVKIGWNDLTVGLVENEARVLRMWEDRPGGDLQVPRVLHQGRWGDLVYVALSPLQHRLLRRGRRNAQPKPEVVREVASLRGIERSPLGGSGYLESLRRRASVLGTPQGDRLMRAVDGLLGQRGDLEVDLGSVHGDWAPWNMARLQGSTFVWDWERAAHGAPVGLDPLHFAFEVLLHKEGRNAAGAALEARVRAASHLAALGLTAEVSETIWRCFLLERVLRVEEGAAIGVPVDEALAVSLLDVLETSR